MPGIVSKLKRWWNSIDTNDRKWIIRAKHIICAFLVIFVPAVVEMDMSIKHALYLSILPILKDYWSLHARLPSQEINDEKPI